MGKTNIAGSENDTVLYFKRSHNPLTAATSLIVYTSIIQTLSRTHALNEPPLVVRSCPPCSRVVLSCHCRHSHTQFSPDSRYKLFEIHCTWTEGSRVLPHVTLTLIIYRLIFRTQCLNCMHLRLSSALLDSPCLPGRAAPVWCSGSSVKQTWRRMKAPAYLLA